MGFNRLQTYLLESEDGASVKASGFHLKHLTTHNDRKSDPSHKAQDDRRIKQLWIKNFRVGSITWEVEDAFGQAA
jgi:hypothetical protein